MSVLNWLGGAFITAAMAVSGLTVTNLRDGRLSVPVVLRLRSEERASPADLANLYIYPQNSDHKVPLTQVADLRFGMDTERIARRNHFHFLQCVDAQFGISPSG